MIAPLQHLFPATRGRTRRPSASARAPTSRPPPDSSRFSDTALAYFAAYRARAAVLGTTLLAISCVPCFE
jgi:hypothetical protein